MNQKDQINQAKQILPSDKAVLPKKASLLPAEEILMIRGEGTYSWIYLRSGRQMFTSRTVKYWMIMFRSSDLMRIHRSFVVHPDCIEKVDPSAMVVQMQGGLYATIARSKKKMVKQWMKVAS